MGQCVTNLSPECTGSVWSQTINSEPWKRLGETMPINKGCTGQGNKSPGLTANQTLFWTRSLLGKVSTQSLYIVHQTTRNVLLSLDFLINKKRLCFVLGYWSSRLVGWSVVTQRGGKLARKKICLEKFWRLAK